MTIVPPVSPAAPLSVRLLTAALLILLFLVVWWWNFPPATAMFFGVFLVAAAREWATLVGWTPEGCWRFVVLVVALCIVGVAVQLRFGVVRPLFALAALWWGIVALLIIATQSGRDWWPSGPLAWAVVGCLTLVPGYLALLWLQQHDRWALLGLFVLIWCADTAAYFAGRRWGRRRLASRLSPGKTWAGAIAAAASGPVLGVTVALWPAAQSRPVPGMALVGVVVVVVSIFGDLFESLVKRRGGFKDSGTVLPGHGGVLDRIDSLLAAAPVYACALTLMADAR